MLKVKHFWKDNTVLSVDFTHIPVNDLARVYRELGVVNCPCVDLGAGTPKWQFGEYFRDGNYWRHIPLDEFPKEFRIQLLLLGVPL